MKQMLRHLSEFGSPESAGRTFDHSTNNSKGFSVSSLLSIGYKRDVGQLESSEGETICLVKRPFFKFRKFTNFEIFIQSMVF